MQHIDGILRKTRFMHFIIVRSILLFLFLLLVQQKSLGQPESVFHDESCNCWKNDSLEVVAEYEDRAFFSSEFNNVRFPLEVNFSNFQFHSYANFFGCIFYSDAYFDESQFDSKANFRFVQFDSNSSFWDTNFNSDADFFGTHFDLISVFTFSRFGSSADFTGARFDSIVSFEDAKFSSDVDFSGSVLPHILYFSNVTLAQEVDFTTTKFDPMDQMKTCYISLSGSDIEKIKIDYERFTLFWLEDDAGRQKHNTYQRLIRKAQLDGFTESEKKLSIEYAQFKYTEQSEAAIIPQYFMLVNILDEHWWNYGYNKELIFRNTLILLGIFLLLNLVMFHYMNNKVYRLDSIWDNYSKYTGKLKFLNTFICAFAYTSTIFFGLKFEYGKVQHNNWWAVAYFYTMYVSGLICLAYLFNFVISN